MPHIRSETANANGNVLGFVLAEEFGQFEQFQRLFKRDGFERLPGLETGVMRFFFSKFFRGANLYHRPAAGKAGQDRAARIRIFTQNAFFVGAVGIQQRFFHRFMERVVKIADHFRPLLFAGGNMVKLPFDVGREAVIHDALEMRVEEIAHNHPHIGRNKVVFYRADDLRFLFFFQFASIAQRKHSVNAFHPIAVFFHHIAPAFFHNFRDGRRISGRAPDAKLF